jgi:DNA-binding response OmpR family regulator
LIEDDENLAELLRDALVHQRYVVDLATDGRTGWDLAEFGEYDLIVLDVQLPDLDGMTLCRRLREQDQSTLVLFLTVQNESSSKVEGLDAGADDYVVKPFDLQELLARIRALLRRVTTASSPVLTLGALQVHLQNCLVTYAGQPLTLTSKEYGLLALFLRNPQRVFSQSALIDRLWTLEESPSENTVRAHIKGLRRKLKKAGGEDIIETIYGIGYRLKVQAASEVVETNGAPPATVAPDMIAPELMTSWERYRERYYDRLEVLDQTIQALHSDRPTTALLQQAQREAHTLIGSLGSFGLSTAEQLARQMHQRLGQITLSTVLSETDMGTLLQQVQALRQALMQPPQLPHLAVVPPADLGQSVRLLMVEVNQPQAEQLAIALQQTDLSADWVIQVDIAPHLTAARQIIAVTPPDVVLLDLSGFQSADEEALRLLSDLSRQQPPMPVLVSTTRDEFSDRIKVARLGAQGFLPKPIVPAQVIAAIDHVVHRTRQVQAKLMAVDDDPQVLEVLHTLLAPWGFELTQVDDPRYFWEVLQSTQPDLLILNIEMPTFDGIDLCQVLRNDQRWYNLPVIFLSAHTDLLTISQAFNAGADDYVSKPIVGPELVTRVLNRLHRVQSLRRM